VPDVGSGARDGQDDMRPAGCHRTVPITPYSLFARARNRQPTLAQ
jgi:hypothetical protein